MKKKLNKGHPIITADIEATNDQYAIDLNLTEIKTIQFSNIINWRAKNASTFVENFKTNIIVNKGSKNEKLDKKLKLNIIELEKEENIVMKFVEYIESNFGDCYVFFVNGRNYDIEFLHNQISKYRDQFEDVSYVVNDLKQYFQLQVKTLGGTTIKFRCTLNLYGGHSVKGWLRTFEKEEIWSKLHPYYDMKGNMKHFVWNTDNLILNEEMKRYCIGDVLIPALYMWRDYQTPKGITIGDKSFPKFALGVLQQSTLPLTASSFAMLIFEKLYNKVYGKLFITTKNVKGKISTSYGNDKAFERDFIGVKYCYKHNQKFCLINGNDCESLKCNCEDKSKKAKRKCEKHNFKYYIKPYKLDNSIYSDSYELTNEDVRAFGYSGGITLQNPKYGGTLNIKGQNIKDNVWIDRVSMYPTAIINNPFPYGEPMKFRAHPTDIPYHILMISKLKLKTKKIPNIMSKNLSVGGICLNTTHKFIENYEGIAFRLDVLTDEYLKVIENTYEIEYEIVKSFYFKATIRQQLIMKALYQVKEDAKKEGNFAKAATAKIVINGFYGKMGQKHSSFAPNWDYDNHTWGENTESDMPTFNIVFAAITTTYARMDLLNAIDSIGYDNFEYSDTDSIHTRNISIEEISKKLPIGEKLGEWEDQSIFNLVLPIDDKGVLKKVKYELIGSKHLKPKCYVKLGYSKELNDYITQYTIAGVNEIGLKTTFDNLEEAIKVISEDFNFGKPIGYSTGAYRLPGGKVIVKDATSTILNDSNAWCNHGGM